MHEANIDIDLRRISLLRDLPHEEQVPSRLRRPCGNGDEQKLTEASRDIARAEREINFGCAALSYEFSQELPQFLSTFDARDEFGYSFSEDIHLGEAETNQEWQVRSPDHECFIEDEDIITRIPTEIIELL
jgi:hypothetical protein